MYPGIEHFNSNIKWKFDESPCTEDDDMPNLEHNLDRIRSLSEEKSFNAYGIKEHDNLLEVEVNDVIQDDSDDFKDFNGSGRECFDEKSDYGITHKFSRNSSLSNRELDVIKESSRSSSDTEVTLTR
ncbi:uncharacterized protein LOC125066901 [Vanessa atalanta]|uniref:uncharacterized protein LOC125066901 n=1 Tax=Vanessa atalanta TaxID=42275 RepID=UPI001FCCD0E6|nr:uncharacterized protein LOC125066901 [Vanessa atalanta]